MNEKVRDDAMCMSEPWPANGLIYIYICVQMNWYKLSKVDRLTFHQTRFQSRAHIGLSEGEEY